MSEGVEIERCGACEIRRTFRRGALVRAEVWRGRKRRGWRLVTDPYDSEAMRYTSLDGLGAYIHVGGHVAYYTAWGDGEQLSREEISRRAWLARCFDDMRARAMDLLPHSNEFEWNDPLGLIRCHS
jgi:hypothetical protein